jgi:hypothetical protein
MELISSGKDADTAFSRKVNTELKSRGTMKSSMTWQEKYAGI